MALNQSLCDNYIDIEFATFIEVKGWMNVVDTRDLNNINLFISVNTDNLRCYNAEIPYEDSVEVPDPCDPTKTILVDNVTINIAKLDGSIGYYIGAEVLNGNPDIQFDDNRNPISLDNYVTSRNICLINDEDFIILNPGELAPADLVVTVMDADIDNAYQNDVNDYVFSVSGIFRISPKPVVQP